MSKFQSEEFRVKFRAFFAVLSFLVGMAFIMLACFSETVVKSEFTGPVIGFVSGNLLTLILTYYYGSSDDISHVPETPIKDTQKDLENVKIPDDE